MDPRLPWGVFEVQSSSDIYLKPNSRKIAFTHGLFFSNEIVFFIEQGSISVVVCANIQNDFTTELDDMDEWSFAKFRLI